MKLVSIAAVLLAFFASPASASPEDVATRVSSEMASPFCPGVTLHDCPSAAADRLRLRIEEWAAAGWSESQIWDELESEFGPNVRAVPSTSGSGLLAWVLPGIALALGAAGAALVAKKWATRDGLGRTPEQAVRAPMAATDRRRLDAELARVREEP